MAADFSIHDKGDGNPHAHILLTMRAIDENGKWLPKNRKVYDLDENGERIRLASGRWKSHKENTVDWNDQSKTELWRQGWSDTVNRYLEAAGRTERLDLRSYARQGVDKIPTVHMGAAVSYMEKKGIQTDIGNLNRDIKEANRFLQSIRQTVRSLKAWIADLQEQKITFMKMLRQERDPTLARLLSLYIERRQEERTVWSAKGQLKGSISDMNKIEKAIGFLRQNGISTVESLDTHLDAVSKKAVDVRADMRKSCQRQVGRIKKYQEDKILNIFEAVKQSVTTRQAAEHYGIRVNKNGMCVCPFHNDKNPSMKVDRRFHCFGCQADGDVIDFVSRLYGLSAKEAALRLAQDFSIPCKDRQTDRRTPVLPRLRQKSHIEHLMDVLLFSGMEERASFITRYEKVVENIAQRMGEPSKGDRLSHGQSHKRNVGIPEL